MLYQKIVEGRFIKRINRFIAEVEIQGAIEKVHVKNTGRCKELFIEGQPVYLEPSSNPERKTKFSLISIYKGPLLVNIDSQVPNKVIYDAILNKDIKGFDDLVTLKREVTYEHSRFDLYFKRDNGKEGFIEIKGVTLEEAGIARFPDAPTSRGTKHVNELAKAVRDGYEAYVVFLIQLKPIKYFTPNSITDPDFCNALKLAHETGVTILAYDALVTKTGINIGQSIPVKL
jgi:sugar fermentation stimulation protein A